MPISISMPTFAKILANSSQYIAPMWLSFPVLNTLAIGAPVGVSGGSPIGKPSPTLTYAITVGGVSKTWPYTLLAGDAGAAVAVTVTASSCGNSVSAPVLTGTCPALPSLPGSVTAVNFTSITSASLTAFWSAPPTGGTPTSYLVAHRVTGSGSFPAGTSTTNLFMSFTGLIAATSYDVQVIAVNATGDGSPTVGTQSTAAGATFGALGYVGGNVNPSLQYNQSAIFFNAVFDGAPFTNAASGPTPTDSNGWPSTGGWQQVISALVNATNTVNQPHLRTGQLTLATYTNCQCWVPSGTAFPITIAGGSITGVTQVSDDGTTRSYTYTLSPTPDSNVVLSGTSALSYNYVPNDGSTAFSGSNPQFNNAALAYYSQFASLRLMDFCNTLDISGGLSGIGKLGEKTWSDPVSGRVPNKTMMSRPYSWEIIFSFAKAIDTYSGGATKTWLNLPAFSDATYASNAAALAASVGLPVVFVEYGNEPWNPGYYFLNEYNYLGYKECQVIADYGTGTTNIGFSGANSAAQITTVTTDASGNVKVSLNVPVSNYPNVQVGVAFSGYVLNGSNNQLFNCPGLAITAVGTSDFTYSTARPFTASVSGTTMTVTAGSGLLAGQSVLGAGVAVGTLIQSQSSGTSGGAGVYVLSINNGTIASQAMTATAPASSSLTNITCMQMVITEPVKIASVISDGAGNVTVTLTGSLASSYPFTITAGVTKMVANCQSISTWNAGTLASPVTVSAVTSNSFTYPCATAPASSTLGFGHSFSCWIGQVASSGVGLDSDLVKGSGGGLGDFNVFDLSGYYYTRQLKRASDAWYAVRPSDKFILGLQTYGQVNPGNQFSPPKHFAFGTYLGNLSGGRPNLSWVYGAATAPYNSAGALTTANAAFATFSANMQGIGYKIDSHVYWSRFYGVVPMAYEWGPDTSSTAVLQIDINADPRMQAMVKTLGDRMLQAGFHETNYFMVTPGAYQQTNVGSGWPSQQTLTDTFTNYKTLGLLQLMAESENYSNANGTAPCSFLIDNSKMSNGATFIRPGIILTFDTIVGGAGYTDGTYQAVPLTPTTNGVQAKAKVVVSGGTVISVDLTGTGDNAGTGYTVGQVLTCAAASIGGTGSGFSCHVATTNTNTNIGAGIASFASSGTRDMSWLGSSNVAGNFTFSALATDSASGTLLTVFIDGVSQGTVTVPQNGTGNSSASSNPTVTSTLSVAVPKGAFLLRVAILSGGTAPGFMTPTLA